VTVVLNMFLKCQRLFHNIWMVLYYSFFLLFWWLMLCGPGGNHFLMFANFDRAQISGSVIIYNAQLHLITSSKILLSVKVMTSMQIYWDDLSPFDVFLNDKTNEKELLCRWVRDVGHHLKCLGKKDQICQHFHQIDKKWPTDEYYII